jgi:hypothetical protein
MKEAPENLITNILIETDKKRQQSVAYKDFFLNASSNRRRGPL